MCERDGDERVVDLCLSCFVVSQPLKKKHRARIIEFFINVAQECFNIGNFNSLMAIISELRPRSCQMLVEFTLTLRVSVSQLG